MSRQDLIATRVAYLTVVHVCACVRVWWGQHSTDSSATVCLPSLILVIQIWRVCVRVSVCFVLLGVCVLCHLCAFCQFLWVCVCTELIKSLRSFLKVGFDPHPHMRVPGMPPSLTGIPGGKP